MPVSWEKNHEAWLGILTRENKTQLGCRVTHKKRKDKPITSSYAYDSVMNQKRGRSKLAEMMIYNRFPV